MLIGRKLKLDTPRWAQPLTREKARYRAAYGGRSSGKSWHFAGMLIERCVQLKTDAVCIREIQKDLTHSLKRTLEILIDRMGIGPLFKIQRNLIKTPHDGIIIFQGMQSHNAESIKSLESFDIALIEEGQNLSQNSLDLLRPTIRKDDSEIWAVWNPRYKTDPIDVFFRGSTPPQGTILVNCNWWDNNWFPDVARKEMEYDRSRDPDKYAHVWCGEYVQHTDAKVFKNWKIDEFETDDNAMFRYGADWGFAQDPTVLIRSYIKGRKLFIDYEAREIGCEILDIPDLFRTVPQSHRWPIIADSSRPETISHLKKHGFPKIYPAVKGKDSIEEGIEWLKTYDIIVHPRCKHTIDELTHYSYKVDKDTLKVLPVLEDRDNHIIDALRYSHEGLRRAEKQSSTKKAHPIPVNNPYS